MEEKKESKPKEVQASEKTADAKDKPQEKGNTKKYKKPLMIVLAVVVVATLVGGAFGLGNYLRGIEDANNPANKTVIIDKTEATDSENDAASGISVEDEECTHDWETNWEIKKIPAETHTEHHDAVYENQTVYHTACNVCHTAVDGADGVREHKNATGHDSGYTPNVPFIESVEVSPAWDETVVDTPESEELVSNGQICTKCGEKQNTKDLSDEQ